MGRDLRPRAPATPDPWYPQREQTIMLVSEAELAEKRATDRALYARWLQRHEAQQVRDRKVRMVLFGAGAVLMLVVLALVALAVWWLSATVSFGTVLLIAVGAVVGLPALATVGHRCVVTVTHHH